MPRPPSAEAQLRFLRDLQRLLEEGAFTATYKYALVHALADLAVQRGDDSGDVLHVPIRAIGERFVELYWRQVAPWPGPDGAEVLAQNTARQAALVRQIREARARWGDRLDRVRGDEAAWSSLSREASRVVRVMPLWKLQRVGREVHDFLYEHERIAESEGEPCIVLRPGVAFCLRAFHPLVLDLVRAGWIRHVRKLNPRLLQERTELGAFLFGASRNVLAAVREPLLSLQEGSCFYCARPLDRTRTAHVDHFVPWSRYPVDLGHNLVVVHDRCNARKADHLASGAHLERWVGRNADFPYALESIFVGAGLPSDLPTSLRVTRWAYRQVADRRGLVWVRGRELRPLDEGWESLLRLN